MAENPGIASGLGGVMSLVAGERLVRVQAALEV